MIAGVNSGALMSTRGVTAGLEASGFRKFAAMYRLCSHPWHPYAKSFAKSLAATTNTGADTTDDVETTKTNNIVVADERAQRGSLRLGQFQRRQLLPERDQVALFKAFFVSACLVICCHVSPDV